MGRQSNLDLNVGYYCKDEQLLDMNYVAEHIGKKTVSSMNAGGVLRDKAHKLFRGTIDFPLGSSGAKGDENEDVLILGEDVINQTVPLILCAEEDVEGNHGASIGRPSDDVLSILQAEVLTKKRLVTLWLVQNLTLYARKSVMRSLKRLQNPVWRRLQAMQMKNFKEDFPLLRENPVVYLDSAATAQRPESVINSEMEFYKNAMQILCVDFMIWVSKLQNVMSNPVKQLESSLMQGRSVK